MTRPLRLDPEHGIHHVYSRGTRRWALFIDRLDYERFIQRLGTVCVRHGISVFAYCLMGNHFHLVVYCPEARLSLAMRDLKSAYARQHNDRHNFSGPLFEARFGSKLVASYEYLRWLGRYVHRNPLAIDSRIDLVAYPWSSLGAFANADMVRPDWLDIEFPLSFFGSAAEYCDFVHANEEGDDLQATGQRRDHATSGAWQPPNVPSISSIALTIASVAGCGVGEVHAQSPNGLVGLAALVATDSALYTAREVMEPLGYRSSGGIYNAKRRTLHRIESDDEFRAIYAASLQLLGLAA